ncbi:MAG: glycine cleavage system aminomethyltransferase GcvT [Verrucomicrobium sp.]|nr:glycine cleavage system aminomethyltransferase GcvT [Verrucomicrobium sp.]
MRHTPLHQAHLRRGARMVEFGGWEMPVFYSSILDEHQAVRTKAGLFDIAHMGEFRVAGPGAGAALDQLLTNDVAKLAVGEGQYTLLPNERGGVIDDLLVYRTGEEGYLLVVNAAKIEEDRTWIASHLPQGVSFQDESDAVGAVALQGPKAAEIAGALLPGLALPARNRIVSTIWNGVPLEIARTGYTGEDGFELFVPAASAEALWEALFEVGTTHGLQPCGLGSRDTLRLEACYPLNGQDLSPDHTPLEAGLGFFVALGKEAEFPGKAVLKEQKASGVQRRLVALKPLEKGAPPRSHYPILDGDRPVGEVTSGTLSPTLGHGIALGYVEAGSAAAGTRLDVEVRGRRLPVEVVPKPFYKKQS